MKKRYAYFLSSAIIITALFSFAAPWASFADEKVGEVTSAVPKSWAMRGGKQTPLQSKSEVQLKDSLATDAKGKLEVKLLDGTVIALGVSSEANVSEFIMTDTKNSFKANIAKGVARVVTGDLVKRNPNGFKITTPRSTVGIRGTEVVIMIQGEDEILSVRQIGPGSHVSIVDRLNGNRMRIERPGQSVVSPKNAPARVVTNDQKMQQLIDDVATDTSAAAPPKVPIPVKEVIKAADKVDSGKQSTPDAKQGDSGNAPTVQQQKKNPLGKENSTPSSKNDNRSDPGKTQKSTSPKPQERCN